MHAHVDGVEAMTTAGGLTESGTPDREAPVRFEVETVETERLEAEIATLAGDIEPSRLSRRPG